MIMENIIHELYKQNGIESIRSYYKNSIVTYPLVNDYKKNVCLLQTQDHTTLYWLDQDNIIPLRHSIVATNEYITSDQFCDGYLCGKKHGYELVITIYPPSCIQYNIIKTILSDQPYSMIVEGQCGLIIVSTRDTITLPPSLWDYFITTIYDTLDKQTFYKNTSWDHWLLIKELFSHWIDRQLGYMTFSLDLMTTILYEMICAHQTTYTGIVHKHCIVSYPSTSITLHGVYHDNTFLPHFMLKNTKKVVSHPLCIKVKSDAEINQIREEVNAVLMGHVTQIQFMEFYFPEQVSYEIDPFGFFYYKKGHENKPYLFTTPLYNRIKNNEQVSVLCDSIQHYFYIPNTTY